MTKKSVAVPLVPPPVPLLVPPPVQPPVPLLVPPLVPPLVPQVDIEMTTETTEELDTKPTEKELELEAVCYKNKDANKLQMKFDQKLLSHKYTLNKKQWPALHTLKNPGVKVSRGESDVCSTCQKKFIGWFNCFAHEQKMKRRIRCPFEGCQALSGEKNKFRHHWRAEHSSAFVPDAEWVAVEPPYCHNMWKPSFHGQRIDTSTLEVLGPLIINK